MAGADPRPPLSFWQIWNMSFGFLGIQFGWALQMANMSAIYEYLGADAHQMPILWLAAPLTGLLVQPVVGHLSDRTWNRLGRRRPYFLTGALLASVALVAMPHSSSLWMAAGLLWVLDASINISMEPFRAFVADKLPAAQRTRGYVDAGAVHRPGGEPSPTRCPGRSSGSSRPAARAARRAAFPLAVRYSFQTGAVVFLAAVLWTVFTTREIPPEDLEAFERMKARRPASAPPSPRSFTTSLAMPATMRRSPWCSSSPGSASSACGSSSCRATARHVFGGDGPAVAALRRRASSGAASLRLLLHHLLPRRVRAAEGRGARLGRKATHASASSWAPSACSRSASSTTSTCCS